MPDSPKRLDQLQKALDAFVRWREDPAQVGAEEFLAAHPDLRDTLEPIVFPPTEEEGVTAPVIDVGTNLGDYRLVRRLGAGGMGTVFEAEQTSLRRTVTLKVLHESLARRPTAVERFRREAAAAARLRHPGIVPIFEVGERHGVHFFVMEHAIGTSLNEALAKGELPLVGTRARHRRAAVIVAEAANALQEAHARGVIHRDVKPHNLLIAEDGTVRLLDFGLASDAAAEGGRDRAALLGTPHYMSPEQAAGEQVQATGDIYSCGVVLFELLTGQRPFDGSSTTEILRKILDEPPPDLATMETRTPSDLVAICGRCLAKDPQRRYCSAAALEKDLRAWLDHEPTVAAPPGRARRLAQVAQRRPTATTAAVLGVLIAVGLPLLLWFQDRRLQDAVEIERRETRVADDTAVAAVDHLVRVLSDRLARQQSLEPGYEAQIRSAVALCVDRLTRATGTLDFRRRLAAKLLDLAAVCVRIGNPQLGLEPVVQATAGLASDRSVETKALRASAHAIQARLLLASHDPQAAAEAQRALDLWSELAADPQLQDRGRIGCATTTILLSRMALDRVDGISDAERHIAAARVWLEAIDSELGEVGALLWARLHVQAGQIALQREDPKAARIEFVAAGNLLETGTLADERPELRAQQLVGSGVAAIKLRELGVAEGLLQGAVELASPLASSFPSDVNVVRTLATAHFRLGYISLLRRDYPAAVESLTESQEAWERAGAGRENAPARDAMASAVACTQLANCHLLSKPAEAPAARIRYHQALAIQSRLQSRAPDVATHLTELGATHSNLAAWENQFGDPALAQRHAEAAVEVQLRALDHRPKSNRVRTFLGIHHAQLAFALEAQGDRDQALAAARKAVTHAPTHAATARMAAEVATRTALILDDTDAAAAERRRAEAVRWLTGLSRGSVSGLKGLLESPRFSSLRGRSDYESLLRAVSR